MDTFQGVETELTNWSKSARSMCFVYKVRDDSGVTRALEFAQTHRRTVIPHGAGHSYTDAALNSGGMVLDVTAMRRILSWDPSKGIMRVEPGVTMRDMVRIASRDGWWPVVSPSTPDVTIGGCAAMNVNGRNAWKCGPFGETILALDVLLVSGEKCTLLPERDPQLFHAFVGSMGLLGIITSITVQLHRLTSWAVILRRRSAGSLNELLSFFADEVPASDFMEGWLDGFAGGNQLGLGHITCATFDDSDDVTSLRTTASEMSDRLEKPFVNLIAGLSRPILVPGIQMANRSNYRWWRLNRNTSKQFQALFPYTYWPSAVITGYHAMFPEGVETFQAFVPGRQAGEIFKQVLCYSQKQECMPIWCIIKKHRCDPFLLSYQVDGFSMELNYQRTHQISQKLERVLQHMIATVIEAGGRFYLAKDHFLTHAQYRQSMGDQVVDTFLNYKRQYDPDKVLQSDLYRRLFQPS